MRVLQTRRHVLLVPVLEVSLVHARVPAGDDAAAGAPTLLPASAGAHVSGPPAPGGGAGGGGTGRQLNGGEVVLTFPATDEGIAGMLHWVAAGTAGSDATYGDPNRPGGQRQSGSFGQMSGFGGGLSAEELAAVVYHERAAFGELDAETIDHELHLLEEVVHVVEDAGESFDGATLDEVRSWVAAASAKLAEDEVAAG